MHKWSVTFLFFSLLLAMPLCAQDVYVSGDSPSAANTKADLEKYTHYRLRSAANNTILVVNEISWSPDFVSPVTTAIQMRLVSSRGVLLWSKTEPVGSRPKDAVVQAMLQDLAEAKPGFSENATKSTEGREPKGKGK